MKKILVILALALIPSFLYAVMSSTVPVSMNMVVHNSIGITMAGGMRFPTQVAGTTPSSVASNGSSAVNGGVNGVDGEMTVTGDHYNYFTLTVCQVGASSCAGSSGNSGTGGSGRLNNSTSYYDVSYSSTNSDNWTNLQIPGTGTVNVWIRGTISATGNAFTAGSYNGSALCTVIYN